MHDFHDFDDFRVNAWMTEGLMIRVVESADSVFNTVKKITSYSMSAAALCALTAFSFPATATATSVANFGTSSSYSSSSQHAANIPAEMGAVAADVLRMTSEIDEQLANLLDFSSPAIDAETLLLANEAVATVTSRNGEVVADWAKGMFDDCI